MRRRVLVLPLAAALAAGLAGAAGLATRPAWAGPAPVQLDWPLNVEADATTVENSGNTLVAHGHVRVTYGSARGTSDVLYVRSGDRSAEFRGHVIVIDPRGRASGDSVTLYGTPDNQIGRVVMTGHAGLETKEYALTADHITSDRRTGRLLAEGHVNAFSAPDLIVTGERLTYDDRARYGQMTGHPIVSNRAGRMLGDRIEMFQAQNRAVVHGPVTTEVYGATVTGERATVDFKTSIAVITGRVVVVRRQGTLWADRLTIHYATKQLVAEGTTRAQFTDLDEDASP